MRVVGNIITGNDQATEWILQKGILSNMQNFLNHNHSDIRREAAWIISNICAGTQSQIQMLFDHNLIKLSCEKFSNDQTRIK